MIRVPSVRQHPGWQEAETVEHDFTEQDQQTIDTMSRSGRHHHDDEEYEQGLEYHPGKLTPAAIKARQIAYMTAAVMWFLLACVGLLVGSEVWKICVHIASS